MTKEGELRECPFCGSEPNEEPDEYGSIVCPGCAMTGPNSCVDKNAIDQWNSLPRRSDLSTAQAQIETLVKERDALRGMVEKLKPMEEYYERTKHTSIVLMDEQFKTAIKQRDEIKEIAALLARSIERYRVETIDGDQKGIQMAFAEMGQYLTRHHEYMRATLPASPVRKGEVNPVCIHCPYYEGYCHFGYSPEPKKRPEGCTGSVIKPDSPVPELGEKKPQDKYGFKEPDSDNPFNPEVKRKVLDYGCASICKNSNACDDAGGLMTDPPPSCFDRLSTGRIQEKGVEND
jgi:hypothetical protein